MKSLLETLPRTPAYVLFAIIANLFIFYFIMQLVTNDRFRASDLEAINLVNFIRMKEQIKPPDEITKEKELEEPPPPDEVPPPPEVPQPEITKPQVSQLDLEMPNLEIPLNVEGTPFLGDFMRSAPNKSDAVSTTGKLQTFTNIKPTLRIPPTYPRRALRAGIEAAIKVKLTIGKDGKVKDYNIIKSEHSDLFSKAISKVISRWKFPPKTNENGQTIEWNTIQNIKFTLQK